MIGFRSGRNERESALGRVAILSGKQWEKFIRHLRDENDHETVVWGRKRGEEGQETDKEGGTWAISSVSEKPKFSENYIGCTGLFVVGTDKETGKPISLLTHHDNSVFMGTRVSSFQAALQSQLKVFKERVIPESITAGFFGGLQHKKGIGRIDSTAYEEAYATVEAAVRDTLGIRTEKAIKPHTSGRNQSSFAAYIDRYGSISICDDASGPGRVLSQLQN